VFQIKNIMKFSKQHYLLDGGMGQELQRRGLEKTGLWSGQALISNPQLVQKLHEDYIRAGADIITTNTYTTTHERLERSGILDRFTELNRMAGQLAYRARRATKRDDVLIAASIPPLRGSYLHEAVGEFDELEPLYRAQAEELEPYVDLMICETMSSSVETLAAVTAIASTGKPAWVAWTLQDGGSDLLRSGETIADAAKVLENVPVSAFLINCCAPESVTAGMAELVKLKDQATSGLVGGYANGFVEIPQGWDVEVDGIDQLQAREDLDPEMYASHVEQWLSLGAQIVGGCCEVGPDHIARMRTLLDTTE